SPKEIDEINILQASILAMHRAIDGLKIPPTYLLIDDNKFKQYKNIPYTCMVKGDGRFSSIAAASILAKTYRDEYMEILHAEYPYYGWNKNKAYPTPSHYQGIEAHGLTPYHRQSFRLARQLKLF
ncbi:MAG: ribonuclease HII, partial [Bacteroidales bacterium]